MISIIILLLILVSAYILTKSNNVYEKFKYDKSFDTPLIMREPNLDKESSIKDNNLVFTEIEFYNLIDKFPTKPYKYQYDELPDYEYDYSTKLNVAKISDTTIKKTINSVFISLSDYLNKEVGKIPEICNKLTPCILKLERYTVLKVGISKNGTICIEGQMLVSFIKRDSFYLINFVCSTEDNMSIHQMDFIGYDIKSNFFNNNFDNDLLYKNFVSIDEPNKQIIQNDVVVNDIIKKRELLEQSQYKCYGKEAINEIECETGDKKGVWDKDCLNDYECPFFKSNKNYPNNYGGCKNGKCELPLGITSISPHKYTNIDKAVCYNCLEGINCCSDQNDKSKYPKLKSPDYKFIDDNKTRIEYNMKLN